MATSGTLNTSAYDGRYLQLAWERTGTNIAANPATSTIHWTLTGAGSAGSSWYYAGPFTVVIDGQTVYSGGSRIQLYDGTTVASGDIIISHNADGTRSFSASVSAAIYSSSQNVSGSGGWDLDALPRASSISCDPLTMGTVGTIAISAASPDFVHTVEYQFGGASGTIGYLTGSGTLYWNPSTDLAAQIPNSQYAAATLTCITYTGQGGSEIGRKSINVDLYTPTSMVPTISAATVSPVNTNGWLIPKNAYVAGWTKARVQTAAAGVKGSTIKSITIAGIGSGSGADWTSGLLDAGVKTISITATDSRGRTASATRSITVLAYAPPSIAGLTYARGSYTGGVWTASDLGADIEVTFTLGLSLLELENAAKLTISLTGKDAQGPAWHGAGALTFYFTAIGTDVSRKLTVLAEDGTGTQSTISMDISTVDVPVNFNHDLPGIRIGGVAEDAETFRCSWPAIFDRPVSLNGIVESPDYPGCFYRTQNGVTTWINPPMIVGVEYRTTERWGGKPVYEKLVSFGALPASTSKSVAHGIANVDHAFIDFSRSYFGYSGTMSYNEWFRGDISVAKISDTTIYIVTASGLSGFNGCLICVKATKTTD